MLNVLRENPLVAMGAALFAAIVVAALLLTGGIAGPGASPVAATGELKLKRVMLSNSGVGYYEFEGRASSGDALFQLPVRLDQADDVLKSAVVFDDQGGAGTIQLPSRAPLSDIFRGLPFGPGALASSQALLEALKGAEVVVSGERSLEGRIVSVTEETERKDGGDDVTRHRVAVMTSGGLRQFVLEGADTVRFKDAILQRQIDDALASMSQHREGQGRTLTIRNTGSKSRTVTVGFVAAAPLWKSSYRITSADNQDKAWLQGWAVLENVSGTDWRDVQLTLVSGNQVTFRQALYQTYYIDRPEIPVEIMGRILPPPDDGAVDADQRPKSAANTRPLPAPAPMMAPPPPPPVMAGRAATGRDEAASPSFDALTGGAPVTESKEAGSQVEFTLPGLVTVLNGQSLSVPIINKQAGAQRLSLYQPATHPRHPLDAVKLVNDTGSALPPGVVTLYHRDAKGMATYVGDARLTGVPKSETRMLAFSLDQKITIDSDRKFDRTVSKLTIANGVMRAAQADVEETAYTIKGAEDGTRNLTIEHERRPGWTLVSPDPKTAEMTDAHFRIPFPVKAGETAQLKVSTEWVREETIGLVNLSTEQCLVYAKNARLSEAQRVAFAKMAEFKRAVDAVDADIQTANAARDRLFEEQQRLRENIGAVPDGSDIQRRYLRNMSAMEDQLESQKRNLDVLDRKRQALTAALSDFIATLSL